MTKGDLLFIAELLDLAGDRFANFGCNDLPERFRYILSDSEKESLRQDYHHWNGDPEEAEKSSVIHFDYPMMHYFAAKLRKEIERMG